MIGPISSSASVSGMQAAQTKVTIASHNIANLQTGGFQRQEVVQTPTPDGGVSTNIVRSPLPGNQLEKDMIDQLAAKNAFLANLQVFKTQNQMTGTLVNLKA